MNETSGWTYNEQNREEWTRDSFESKEAMIKMALQDEDFVKNNYVIIDGDVFLKVSFGTIHQPTICDNNAIELAEPVIQLINAYHACEYGEYGDDYLDHTDPDLETELNDILKDAIEAWATKHNLQPRHFQVQNVTEELIPITEDSAEAMGWIAEMETKRLSVTKEEVGE